MNSRALSANNMPDSRICFWKVATSSAAGFGVSYSAGRLSASCTFSTSAQAFSGSFGSKLRFCAKQPRRVSERGRKRTCLMRRRLRQAAVPLSSVHHLAREERQAPAGTVTPAGLAAKTDERPRPPPVERGAGARPFGRCRHEQRRLSEALRPPWPVSAEPL